MLNTMECVVNVKIDLNKLRNTFKKTCDKNGIITDDLDTERLIMLELCNCLVRGLSIVKVTEKWGKGKIFFEVDKQLFYEEMQKKGIFTFGKSLENLIKEYLMSERIIGIYVV